MTEELPVVNHSLEQKEIQPNDNSCIDESIFSLERLLERFGDEETAIEVISIFLNDNTERFKELTKAIEAGDVKQMKFFAHSLRGAGGNIGSKSLWDIGSKMEHAIVQGDLELAATCYEELKPVFEKLVEFFSRSDWLEVAKQVQVESS